MSKTPFTKTAARRTRISVGILADPARLESFCAEGGTKEDLEVIRDRGHEAEHWNMAQSGAQAGGRAGTGSVLGAYLQLLIDYRAIMNAVIAMRGELVEAKGDADLITRIGGIIENEAAVHFRAVGEGDAKKMKAAASKSQEAVRAEIEKDAVALIGLEEAHALLAKRRVDLERLEKLQADAAALSGKVVARAAKKGEAAGATAAEHAAVAAQSHRWQHCFRALHDAALKNPAIAALFTDPTE